MSRSYTSSPPSASMSCSGTALPLPSPLRISYSSQMSLLKQQINESTFEFSVKPVGIFVLFVCPPLIILNLVIHRPISNVNLNLVVIIGRQNFIICTHPQISLGKSSQGE
jgi:hypothetical protein